jgi:hypothetical protein
MNLYYLIFKIIGFYELIFKIISFYKLISKIKYIEFNKVLNKQFF